MRETMDGQVLAQVRQLVTDLSTQHEFDDCELDMVQKDDFFVSSFLEISLGSVDQAAAAILKALVYRKKYEFYKVGPQDVAMEMFALQLKTGTDIYGTPIDWNFLGNHRTLPEIVDQVVKLGFVTASPKKTPHDLYLDVRGLSWRSIDMRMTAKLSSLMGHCFPTLIGHTFIVGVPVLLTPVINKLIGLLPSIYSKKITFLSVDEAKKRIHTLECLKPPPGSSNLYDILTQRNISEVRIQEIVDTVAWITEKNKAMFATLKNRF
ncbi:hypothetical protein HDE_00680 [Halotydeus destructor]|nr:hypothetical protein HDE_00680 [Halotydeus destructor]